MVFSLNPGGLKTEREFIHNALITTPSTKQSALRACSFPRFTFDSTMTGSGYPQTTNVGGTPTGTRTGTRIGTTVGTAAGTAAGTATGGTPSWRMSFTSARIFPPISNNAAPNTGPFVYIFALIVGTLIY
jgi:hypothetical protein